MRPDFRKKEIIVEKPNESEAVFGIVKNARETIATVKYKGADATKYEVGDKILFDMKVAMLQIDAFGTPLLRIENEDYIICRILEDE